MKPLRARDCFQIVTTGLFIVLGVLILVRVSMRGVSLAGYVTGLAFLAFGLYRARLIASGLRCTRKAR